MFLTGLNNTVAKHLGTPIVKGVTAATKLAGKTVEKIKNATQKFFQPVLDKTEVIKARYKIKENERKIKKANYLLKLGEKIKEKYTEDVTQARVYCYKPESPLQKHNARINHLEFVKNDMENENQYLKGRIKTLTTN